MTESEIIFTSYFTLFESSFFEGAHPADAPLYPLALKDYSDIDSFWLRVLGRRFFFYKYHHFITLV